MHKHLNLLAILCKSAGIKHIVLSPGSRSAPLVYAFAIHHHFVIHTVVDERSAAYKALGMAQYLQQPVILICTSGTAAANYLPAITEAHYRKIPLLVFTADRPPHLLNQQDGQMINQQHLYGSHTRIFLSLKTHYQQKEYKQLATSVRLAINQITIKTPGVAHINIPLSEPLYNGLLEAREIKALEKAWGKWHVANELEDKYAVNTTGVADAWLAAKRKLIVIGEGPVDEKMVGPLMRLQNHSDVTILADVASNKHPYCTTPYFDQLIGSLNQQELETLAPDFILSMGGAMLSKSLKNWLRNQQPTWHFRVKTEPEHIDTYGNLTGVIETKPSKVLAIVAHLPQNANSNYRAHWLQLSHRLAIKMKQFMQQITWNELQVTAQILEQLHPATQLHLANSSVVRYASLSGKLPASVLVNANRGASGIDGCTSTAVGAAMVNKRPTVLLTGDLAFLYDKNALWQPSIPDNLRIIVLNNNGGGIFSLIDGPTSVKKLTPLFTTPHQQNIKAIAQGSGLEYYFCDNNDKLNAVLERFFNPLGKAALLELKFNMEQNAQAFKKFKKISI